MSPVKTQRWWMMATCLMHTSCKHVCILTNNTLMTWLEKSSKVQTQINKKKHPGQQGCQTADLTQTLSITPVDIWGHFQLFLFRRKAAVFQRKLDHLHPWSWSPEPNHNVFLNLTRAPYHQTFSLTSSVVLWKRAQRTFILPTVFVLDKTDRQLWTNFWYFIGHITRLVKKISDGLTR